ncbi:MAG TPA: hypothetical protein VHH90_02475 [Polyangia bacterium]|nr:hypothetical protein [Polyangia bacterium]
MSTGGDGVRVAGGPTGDSGVMGESVGFAAKMVGIGLCAGLALVSCQFLIEACFRAAAGR